MGEEKQPSTPTPVNIVDSEKALPVTIEEVKKEPPHLVNIDDKKTLAPTTTQQEDVTTNRQSRINLIWEITQAFIAVSVTSTTVIALLSVSLGKKVVDNNQLMALMQLVGMTLLILGFYFSRTNHAAVGGVGKQETQKYIGR